MTQKISIHKTKEQFPAPSALWWRPLFDWQQQLNKTMQNGSAQYAPLSFWPTDEGLMRGWQQNVNRLLGELLNQRQMLAPWLLGGQQEPYVDILENEKSFFVKADLSGVDAKDLDVSLSGRELIIRGESGKESNKESGMEDAHYIHHECTHGAFSRTIALPEEADMDQAEARFDRNVLIVEIPKKAGSQSKTRKLAIANGDRIKNANGDRIKNANGEKAKIANGEKARKSA